jgi:hypothetical protein
MTSLEVYSTCSSRAVQPDDYDDSAGDADFADSGGDKNGHSPPCKGVPRHHRRSSAVEGRFVLKNAGFYGVCGGTSS